ncbi:MAG: ribosome assembly factor SBDS [Candidatus Geothermarchaeales archaeon]
MSFRGAKRGSARSELGKAEYTLARFARGGKRFEILVDPNLALEYKLKRTKDLAGILVFDTVYTDHKKGLKASQEDLIEMFDTTDVQMIAERIMEKGDVLIRTDQRRQVLEEKEKQIASYISRHCVDTRTGAPIPYTRVERGLQEIVVRIDPFARVEEQVPEIIRKLAEIIPLRQQVTVLEVVIPAVHVGRAMGFVKEAGETVHEEWLRDGSYKVRLVLPSGLKVTFIEKLGSFTRGTARADVVEERGA